MGEMKIGQGIPGEAMAMDIGTLPWTDYPGEGYIYFLLMVDLFTRYVEVQPQSDGMAERNVGLVKQVVRCLQLDRQLAKGSWPGLLTEVSFHINSMENATSRISPHLLHLGREPRSPLDAWCTRIHEGERNNHGEYQEALRRKRSELRSIAQENITKNLGKARARYNQGKRESDIAAGDQVMLKSGQLKDSLSPRYTGPYEVVERRGPDVKVRLKRRDKWVHIDNTKRFRGSEDLTDLHSDETQVVPVLPRDEWRGSTTTAESRIIISSTRGAG